VSSSSASSYVLFWDSVQLSLTCQTGGLGITFAPSPLSVTTSPQEHRLPHTSTTIIHGSSIHSFNQPNKLHTTIQSNAFYQKLPLNQIQSTHLSPPTDPGGSNAGSFSIYQSSAYILNSASEKKEHFTKISTTP